ncbi:MAG: hypothetical protein MZW92_10200 [Comamonadaceae bacterium]|nr:hypothetical protein [Comamonadaceae bacterium]
MRQTLQSPSPPPSSSSPRRPSPARSAAQARPAGPAGPPPPLPKVFVDWPGSGHRASSGRRSPSSNSSPSSRRPRSASWSRPPGPPGQRRSRPRVHRPRGVPGRRQHPPPTRRRRGARPRTSAKAWPGRIKLGLLRYAAKTPVAKDLSVKFLDQAKPTSVDDKWDFWVFSLSGNAFLMGETQYRNGSYYASVSANRVTPELKVRTSGLRQLER